jgi:hypothetical protein
MLLTQKNNYFYRIIKFNSGILTLKLLIIKPFQKQIDHL